MNKSFQRTVVLAALMGLALMTAKSSQADETAALEQTDFPKVMAQPVDRFIERGSNVTFTVKAENQDGFQWTRNGELIQDATNSTLTLENVTVEDAGYYSCWVLKGEEAVPTRSAAMYVTLGGGGGSITVFGSPTVSGGSRGSCPGAYAGYVNFIKMPGWGWKPDTSTSIHSACDNVRTDTKVEYVGIGLDRGCNQTCVTLPTTPPSPCYRFTIYFPNNVPTTNYPITLTGFLP